MERLAGLLLVGDVDGVADWVKEHVTPDRDGWETFVISLAGFCCSAIEAMTARMLGPTTKPIVYLPARDADASPATVNAELIVSCLINDDRPGVLGILAAVDEHPGGIQDVSVVLVAAAMHLLRMEAATA
jgi:hypothetical protein